MKTETRSRPAFGEVPTGTAAPPPRRRPSLRVPHLRWAVAALLLAAAVLNYVDRNVLSLLAPTIQADLHVSDAQYARVVSAFLAAYTLAYLLSGRIVDRLGVRLSVALFVGWWSVSNALTGLARSFASLCGVRFLLGLGEAGLFTAAPKAVAEWFPPRERGLAIGLYGVGSALGATIAPLLVVHVAARFGWRAVFLVTLAMAWTWLACWLLLYRSPHSHRWITEAEKALLPPPEKAVAAAPWRQALAQPFVWRLMAARLLTDPVWYFFQFWMPKYLHDARGVSQDGLAAMWKVFLAADVGFVAGGFLAGRLIRRGVPAPAARVAMLACCAAVVPLAAFVPGRADVGAVLALAMAVACAQTAWLANLTALIVDIAPRPVLGTSFGIVACGSALGGILMNAAVSWLIAHRSYADCFYLLALLHPLALLAVWKLRHRPAPVPS